MKGLNKKLLRKMIYFETYEALEEQYNRLYLSGFTSDVLKPPIRVQNPTNKSIETLKKYFSLYARHFKYLKQYNEVEDIYKSILEKGLFFKTDVMPKIPTKYSEKEYKKLFTYDKGYFLHKAYLKMGTKNMHISTAIKQGYLTLDLERTEKYEKTIWKYKPNKYQDQQPIDYEEQEPLDKTEEINLKTDLDVNVDEEQEDEFDDFLDEIAYSDDDMKYIDNFFSKEELDDALLEMNLTDEYFPKKSDIINNNFEYILSKLNSWNTSDIYALYDGGKFYLLDSSRRFSSYHFDDAVERAIAQKREDVRDMRSIYDDIKSNVDSEALARSIEENTDKINDLLDIIMYRSYDKGAELAVENAFNEIINLLTKYQIDYNKETNE